MAQFGSSISQLFSTFIPHIEYTKDRNMLAEQIWRVMMEKSQSMIGL